MRVASTRTHTAACGALNALWTIESAIARSTPRTGMRSSAGPESHGAISRPAKRLGVVGAAIGARGAAATGAPEGPLDVVARDEAVAARSGERRQVQSVLLGVEAHRRRRAR